MRSRESFTLIEMLVVIGIIATLMALIMPSMGKMRRQAQSTKCKANLRILHAAAFDWAYSGNRLPYADSWDEEDDEVLYDGQWGWYNQRAGWVHWVDYPYKDIKSWAKRPDSVTGHPRYDPVAGGGPVFGVTKWWGPIGVTNIKSGTIWKYTGKRMAVYLCPTFARPEICGTTAPDGGPDFKPVVRSYLMSSDPEVNGHSIVGLSRASKTLMFTEGHTRNQDLVGDPPATPATTVCAIGLRDGETGSYDVENGAWDDAWDGSLNGYTEGGQLYSHESIGQYHGGGKVPKEFPDGHLEYYASKGNAVFADGHVETLVWNQIDKACRGAR